MKKRNLIVVNTYFQLITVINMTLHNLNNDINDIIITDISVGAEKKVERLKKLNIFNNVYFIKYKQISSESRVKKYITYLFNRDLILKTRLNNVYDELIFYNLDILSYSLIDELFKNNKKLVCSIYDEGIGTYTIYPKNNKINSLLRTILFRPNIDKLIKKIYLYHPNLICYKCNFELNQIPKLDSKNTKFKNILNSVFEYKKVTIPPQKYIFFEEAFFCDNKDIDDYELILKIAEIVGKDNIIVKLHPRNKTNRFNKVGIPTWANSEVPWEVIQMNENYSNKIFLSISSGTILMSKLFFEDQIKSYYLFNCTNNMSDLVNDNFHQYLNKIEKNLSLNNLIIPETKEQFLKLLEEEQEVKK